MRIRVGAIAATSVLLLVAAIALLRQLDRPGPLPSPSLGEAWELTSATLRGRMVEPLPGYPTTLVLAESGLYGSAVCNTYSGRFEQSGSDFRVVGGLATTLKSCPADREGLEDFFIQAIMAATRIERSGDRLELSGPNVLAQFVLMPRLEVAPAINTWMFNSGRSQGTELPPGLGSVTLTSEGVIEYATDCRTRSGSYVVQPDFIVVTRLSGLNDCQNAEAMDEAFSAAFQRFRLSVEEGELRVTAPGAIDLRFESRN